MRGNLRLLAGAAVIASQALFMTVASTPMIAHADVVNGYMFEDGSDGFTAPSWLGANAGQPFQSADEHSQGQYSLALPVKFTGGSWDQSGADVVFSNYQAVDLSNYAAITYDVYAPTDNLSTQLIFNDPWFQPTVNKPLHKGWNAVTWDISPTSTEFPNGASYFQSAKEMILAVIGQGATYQGDVYFDNVQFISSKNPTINIQSPVLDSTIQSDLGQTYQIQANVKPSYGNTLQSVTWTSQSQSGTMTLDPSTGLYVANWDLWKEGEGVQNLTITAIDSSGAQTTRTTSVYVHDSQLQVQVENLKFDQTYSGKVSVQATVQQDPRFQLKSVTLQAGNLEIPMQLVDAKTGEYQAQLDTHQLPDGVQTIRAIAADSQFTVADPVDILISNHPVRDGFVSVKGYRFSENGEPFRYVGWNEYDLFTRQDETVPHTETTSEGNVLLKGTPISWRDQIDRQMGEAERNGLSVLRTWAFDFNNDGSAFETGPNQFNETEFQKLDYIMASAQRHHIKVILTLNNYWNDYGGIQQYANWLGLSKKLAFFTNPQAKQLYKDYVAHLVNRTNTVTGVTYKDDPTIFAWELINEPRIDSRDDPSGTYADASGNTLRNWVDEMSSYIKSIDGNHMVTAGFEGHGFVKTGPGTQGLQWAGTTEGDNNDPIYAQNVKSIDFFTFHPYPNASWADLTMDETNALIEGITKEGIQAGKPVVMEEYGIDRSEPVFDTQGHVVQTTDGAYNSVRTSWYKDMLDTFYQAGGAGSNVWDLADWSDNNYNINLYLPPSDVARDQGLVQVLHDEAIQVSQDKRNNG